MVGQQTFNTPNINPANNSVQYFALPASASEQAKYNVQQQHLVPQNAMYQPVLTTSPQQNDE